MSFLIERRLKENDGTHRTSVRVKCAEILTVPMSNKSKITIRQFHFGRNGGSNRSEKRNGVDHMISGSSINNP
jgi:hypothetical protein